MGYTTGILTGPVFADKKPDVDDKDEKIKVLDAGDIQLLKTYGQGPYASVLKRIEKEVEEIRKRINEQMGVKESETGLAAPNLVRYCRFTSMYRELTRPRSGTYPQISREWEKSSLCR